MTRLLSFCAPEGSRLLSFCVLLTAAFSALGSRAAWAGDWPQWRGPEQNGVSRETRLPIVWSDSAGVAWKCALPEWGDSTPVIWGEAIFLTSHTDDGKLLLLRINRQSGRIDWSRQVGSGSAERAAVLGKEGDQRRHQKFHEVQNFASPSPVTDGEVVVAHFGNGDLAAYDFQGQQLWHRNLQQDYGDYTIWWGHANSPVLYQDLVISICLQDSCRDLPGKPSPSYVVAHDKRTGEVRWFRPRPTDAPAETCDAYTTPLVWQRAGQAELVVMGGQILDAYDPASGKRIWWLPRLVGNRMITGPVAAEGTIYATQGMRQAALGRATRRTGPTDPQRRRLEVRPGNARQSHAGRLGRAAVLGHQQRHRPLPRPAHRPAQMEGAAQGRLPRLAAGCRRPHLLPQHEGPDHGGQRLFPFRSPRREPSRRRDHRFTRG